MLNTVCVFETPTSDFPVSGVSLQWKNIRLLFFCLTWSSKEKFMQMLRCIESQTFSQSTFTSDRSSFHQLDLIKGRIKPKNSVLWMFWCHERLSLNQQKNRRTCVEEMQQKTAGSKINQSRQRFSKSSHFFLKLWDKSENLGFEVRASNPGSSSN